MEDNTKFESEDFRAELLPDVLDDKTFWLSNAQLPAGIWISKDTALKLSLWLINHIER